MKQFVMSFVVVAGLAMFAVGCCSDAGKCDKDKACSKIECKCADKCECKDKCVCKDCKCKAGACTACVKAAPAPAAAAK